MAWGYGTNLFTFFAYFILVSGVAQLITLITFISSFFIPKERYFLHWCKTSGCTVLPQSLLNLSFIDLWTMYQDAYWIVWEGKIHTSIFLHFVCSNTFQNSSKHSSAELNSSAEMYDMCSPMVFQMNHVGDVQSTQQAPTVVISERAAPVLRAEDGGFSCGKGTPGIHTEECSKSNRWFESLTHSHSAKHKTKTANWILLLVFPLSVFADIKTSSGAESQNHSGKAAIRSSSSEENDSVRKPPLYQGKREKTRDSQSMFATQVMLKSGYESGYDAGETDNELDQDHTHHLYRWVYTL